MNQNTPYDVYLQITRQNFKPAKKIGKNTWVVTAEMLAKQLEPVYPGLNPFYLSRALMANGFAFQHVPGVGLRWTMKPKKECPV